MKIKVIDLINVANEHKKMPRKIKFNDIVWLYLDFDSDYESTIKDEWLFQDYIPNHFTLLDVLNNEVEIINENKQIEFLKTTTNDKLLVEFKDKINEVIDVVNKMKEDN